MVASLKTLNSASSTTQYFENDRSYYVDGETGDRWFGKGAKALKLRGGVEIEDFERVLRGEMPGRIPDLGRIVDGERVHRPGWDLTISMPKSASIAALVTGDDRIIDVHRKSVAKVLEHIEGDLITTRRWDPDTKRMARMPAGSMVAATFLHEASRNLDPLVHTHCVIANMAKGGDGKWRSVESLERDKLYIGAYYRNEMARGLLALGYELRERDIGGMPAFEIKGFTPDTLEEFSTRRTDILAYIKERGWRYNATTAQIATLATRPKKIEISREEFRARCVERGKELGIENPLLGREHERPRKDPAIDRQAPDAEIFEAINRNIDHIECRTAVFNHTMLKARVLGQLAGRVTVEQIDGRIFQMEKDGHLVRSTRRGADIAWVTSETLKTEREMVKFMKDGQGQARPLAPEFNPMSLDNRGLTEDQANAVKTVLASTDRVLGVQGYAGTGKTTLLSTLVDMAPEDQRFFGLAPSTSATIELGKSGIPSRTLQYFLTRYGDIGRKEAPAPQELRDEFRNTTLVLDESSMVSTRQMKAFFDITRKLEVERVVLVGDKDQLRAVEAGQPFRQLQDHGMETAEVKQIVRQKDKGLKAAVEATVAGNISLAMKELASKDNVNSQLIEIEPAELAMKAGKIWLALEPEERENTLLVAQTHELRREIHDTIREELEIEGRLTGKEFTHERLVNRHMTPEQRQVALNYTAGDVLVFKPNYTDKQGDHYTVTAVGNDGRLYLEHRNGHVRCFNPAKGNINYNYDVYAPIEIELRAGDRIRFTRQDRDRGINNGQLATIAAINDRVVKLRRDDDPDKILELVRNSDTMRHIDHGYSHTTHGAQGKTADRVIAVLDSGIGQLTDQQQFYVQISRAKGEAVVVTDNAQDLAATLEQNTGERMTAMEAVGEFGHTVEKRPAAKPNPEQEQGQSSDIVVNREFLEMYGLELPERLPLPHICELPSIENETSLPEKRMRELESYRSEPSHSSGEQFKLSGEANRSAREQTQSDDAKMLDNHLSAQKPAPETERNTKERKPNSTPNPPPSPNETVKPQNSPSPKPIIREDRGMKR